MNNKKKTKKKETLYQEDAIKYFNLFSKKKRSKKGINLSLGCGIFKTAWELPESNGLILSSRIVRHFKQVLPKKPKKKVNKNNNKKKKKNGLISTNQPPKPNIPSTPNKDKPEEEQQPDHLIRSRTMMDIKFNATSPNALNPTFFNHPSISPINSPFTKLENTINNELKQTINEQDIDEKEQKKQNHMKAKSIDDLELESMDLEISKTNKNNISIKKEIIKQKPNQYIDHADITNDDVKPDIEEQNVMIQRAETDINQMDLDHINFETEVKQQIIVKDNKTNKKKKKKKKAVILYYEDATRLFKKINDGKRFKNGITLSKACKIFNVAWEIPEEKGRILPSKVVKHFKNVFPSKKNKSILKKSVTVRHNAPTSTISGSQQTNTHIPSRSHMPTINKNLIFSNNNNYKIINNSGNKNNEIHELERMMSNDRNRTNEENDFDINHEKINKKNKRAASLTKIDLDLMENKNKDNHDHDDQVIEHEIDDIIKQKKEEKNNMIKEKQKETVIDKEQDILNALNATFI